MEPQTNSQWLTGAPNPDGVGTKAKQSMAALAGMLLVAAVGAILNWPWWLEYALITPLATWLIINSRLVVYRQLNSNSASPDRRVPVVLVVPILFAAAIQPTRFSGLVVVAGFAVIYISSIRGPRFARAREE